MRILNKPNRFLLVSCIFAVIICVAACSRARQPWDSPSTESDELMRRFDKHNYEHFRDFDTMLAMADTMKKLGESDPIAMGRYYYMMEDISIKQGKDSLTLAYADKARELIDSASLPYDWTRVDFVVDLRTKERTELYTSVTNALRVFEQYNDTSFMAQCHTKLGVIHYWFGDFESALSENRKAHDLCVAIKDYTSDLRICRSINLYLHLLGRHKEAFEILDSVRMHNPVFGRDVSESAIILTEIYDSTKNLNILRQAMAYADKIAPGTLKRLSERSFIASKLGLHFLQNGETDSARYYERISNEGLEDGREVYNEMYRLKRDLAFATGDSVTGRETESILNAIEKQEALEQENRDIQSGVQASNLQDVRNDSEARHRRISIRTLAIAVVIVVAVVFMTWIVVRNIRRRNAEKVARLNESLGNTQSKLNAANIRNAEKEKAMSQALSDLDEIKKDSSSASYKSVQIANRLKLAISSESEWDKFEVEFKESNKPFFDALTAINPSLTKGDIRIACMVRMGIDNKQISRILSINVDSVKKYRQRLRAKLGIASETTLPDFLTKLGNNTE